MKSIQSQSVIPISVNPIKVCLGCGTQIPNAYIVCPYCHHRNGPKRNTGWIVTLAGLTSIVGGIVWFIAGLNAISSTTYSDWYHTRSPSVMEEIAIVLLYTSGLFSIIVGLFSIKRENYLLVVILTVCTMVFGLIAAALLSYYLGEFTIINLFVFLTLIIYRDNIVRKENIGTPLHRLEQARREERVRASAGARGRGS